MEEKMHDPNSEAIIAEALLILMVSRSNYRAYWNSFNPRRQNSNSFLIIITRFK
jgi:hypothetical protein